MSILNQYSLLWVTVFLSVAAVLLFMRKKPRWPAFLAASVLILGLIFAWTMLRPRQAALPLEAAGFQAMIGQGTPVLLEFQSPY